MPFSYRTAHAGKRFVPQSTQDFDHINFAMPRVSKPRNYKSPARKRARVSAGPTFDVMDIEIAKQVDAAVAQARRAQMPGRAEIKGLDTDLDVTPVLDTTNTNGSIFPVNLIAPGNGSFNRIGRKAILKSLRLRGVAYHTWLQAATTGNQLGNTLRGIVVWDKQPSGVLPTFDTIFGRTVQDGTESTEIYDVLKYDNTNRFQVLRDFVIDMPVTIDNQAGGNTDSTSNVYKFDYYIDLANRTTIYSGQSSTQTIADISSGALYVIWRAEFNSASTFVTLAKTFGRLRYTD